MEELLKEAKEKFPLGTIFINAFNSNKSIITCTDFVAGNNNNIYPDDGRDEAFINKELSLYENGCIWFKGEWAKIICPELNYEIY